MEIDGKIDLTLRLGLPYYDMQNQADQKASHDKTLMHNLSNINILTSYNQARENYERENRQVNEHVKFNIFAHHRWQSLQTLGQTNRGGEGEKEKKLWSCNSCGKKETPLSRKGPDGPQTLCNACGLRYSRALKKAAKTMGPEEVKRNLVSSKRTGG